MSGRTSSWNYGPADLALQDGKLMAQRKNLDVLVTVAHRQQTYEGKGVRHHRKVDQSQHRTIMPPAGGDLASEPAPDRAKPACRDERPSGRWPGQMASRHPQRSRSHESGRQEI
ncbi:hypothetical protein ABIA33_003526 [Streptacidiphilus sp. MAP12-16]|uniref:hypothetical protein n=1 Tax=Streptacidiphilus sp. MAP12-16 TaxID=3156300 RepID=UPI0035164DFE